MTRNRFAFTVFLLVCCFQKNCETEAFITAYPSYQRTRTPTHKPTRNPTTIAPTEKPSVVPTFGPTLPTSQPSSEPSFQPFGAPTSLPSNQPFSDPSSQPSAQPTSSPSIPTSHPSGEPSSQPSVQPISAPTSQPNSAPTQQPTAQPNSDPTSQPTGQPSRQPTGQPSRQPSSQPSRQPSSQPSAVPTFYVTKPTMKPTARPSNPSLRPTMQPTQPTSQPSGQPSGQPVGQPSSQPSRQPSGQPTGQPSRQPTGQPTSQPTRQPSGQPTRQPLSGPSSQPTGQPSGQPSPQPSRQPTGQPSRQPSRQPSGQPTGQPTRQPSSQPTAQPTCQPTSTPTSPTGQPSSQPTRQPSGQPSRQPSAQPTSNPTQPTSEPTNQPSSQPTCQPTSEPTSPTSQPTSSPSGQPSVQPTSHPSRPTLPPTFKPTVTPTMTPTAPTVKPTLKPTVHPTVVPTISPSHANVQFNGYMVIEGVSFAQYSTNPSAFESAIKQAIAAALTGIDPAHVMSLIIVEHTTTVETTTTTNSTLTRRKLLSTTDSIAVSFTVETFIIGASYEMITSELLNAISTGFFNTLLHTSAATYNVIELATAKVSTVNTADIFPVPTMAPTTTVYHVPRYQSLSAEAFDVYTPLWTKTHESWLKIDENHAPCEQSHSVPSYPVCVDGYMIPEPFSYKQQSNNKVCPSVQCIKSLPSTNSNGGNGGSDGGGCSYTPSDTIDYLPPTATTAAAASNTNAADDSDVICPYHPVDGDAFIPPGTHTMDQGIPPYYLPVTPVRLHISGRVVAQVNGQCVPVNHAQIIAWQINPLSLEPFTIQSQYEHTLEYTRNGQSVPVSNTSPQTDVLLNTTTTATAPEAVKGVQKSLRDLSCRGMQHTAENGSYTFTTLMPPSYGPPRHIMFTITAPGYQNLTTRIYFDHDHRLQQLTTQHGEVHSRVVQDSPTYQYDSVANTFAGAAGVDDADIGRSYNGYSLFNDKEKDVFPGPVAKDPRVARLSFRNFSAVHPESGLLTGRFETVFDFVLSPLRTQQSDVNNPDISSVPPIDIDGMWSEPSGGLVKVTTTGTSFMATQYPHSRSWGGVLGTIAGDTIRGVDFHQIVPSASHQQEQGQQQQKGSDKLFQGETYTPSNTHWNTGTTSGIIVPNDAFATAGITATQPLAVSIQWSGGGYDGMWSKYIGTKNLLGHRYLKLVITRETGERALGQMVINEIQFYEGILTQTEQPKMKMISPRSPSPQMVSCSSFLNQDSHCYKAFDGDVTANSAWVTKAVGSNRHTISTPQWITFDFGKGRTIVPTGMRIICDSANRDSPKGCPMTFSLLGSQDNIHYDVLNKQDLYDGSGIDYAGDSGKMFYFIYEHSAGRMNGQRCGSCENGPHFTCNIQAYDGSCNTKYCNINGLCDSVPPCPIGEYSDFAFTAYNKPSFQCKQCAPGRYGNTSGLTSSYCSGLCDAGYYCLAGSTNPRATPCGNKGVFCPEGSGAPLLAAAGRYTMSHYNTDSNNDLITATTESVMGGTVQTHEVLCEPGHYCTKGVSYKCPLGTYGEQYGLQTAECTRDCDAGTYCPEGSITPTVCETGYYCPDGKTKVVCPPGTYGVTTGLNNRACSGLCQPGYYCEAGSISATSKPCIAGRYGSVAGLTNATCSGYCSAGYYCPTASVTSTAVECGGSMVYCPLGSAEPKRVSKGYYTTGGYGPTTRTSQTIAENGFYTAYGVRKSCPSGTYGDTSGLDYGFDVIVGNGTASLTLKPTSQPTLYAPTKVPTAVPSTWAPTTAEPSFSQIPSIAPTTLMPTLTRAPTMPTMAPSRRPTSQPTSQPSSQPTGQPTTQPSRQPTSKPTQQPTSRPSGQPSRQPTGQPTGQPSRQPTGQPTMMPSGRTFRPTPEPSRTSFPSYVCSSRWPTSTPSFADFSVRPTMAPTIIADNPRTHVLCSGTCEKGYYCPLNSTTSTQFPCPAGRYGATTGLQSAECTATCPLGHYCLLAAVTPTKCPGGVFGNVTGLADASCSNVCWAGGCQPNYCQAGYFCPPGSFVGTQYTCGGVGKFCPKGSSQPTPVSPGYYSTAGPQYAPTTDSDTVERRTGQMKCETGHYCVGGVRSKCPPGVFGSTEGLTTAGCTAPCPPGHYCPEGSYNGTTFRCPAGRYGNTSGLYDSACTGICEPGYHCPEASISATQLQCAVFARQTLPQTIFPVTLDGSFDAYLTDLNTTTTFLPNSDILITTLQNPNNVYCPAGSAVPLLALPGFYTQGGNATTRSEQMPCPMGTYCQNGVVYDCPAGRYGRAERLSSSECTGLCAKGHYCLSGSSSRTQYTCPKGRYGATEGLTSALCSGACLHPEDCGEGSIIAMPQATA